MFVFVFVSPGAQLHGNKFNPILKEGRMTVSVLRAMDVWTDIDGGHSKTIPRKFSSTMPTPAPNVNDMVGIVHFS